MAKQYFRQCQYSEGINLAKKDTNFGESDVCDITCINFSKICEKKISWWPHDFKLYTATELVPASGDECYLLIFSWAVSPHVLPPPPPVDSIDWCINVCVYREYTTHFLILPLSSQDPPVFLPDFKNPCWMENRTLRCLPYFYLAGVAKSGTTDLYHRITQHPHVLTLEKENHWWVRTRFSRNKGKLQSLFLFLHVSLTWHRDYCWCKWTWVVLTDKPRCLVSVPKHVCL